MSYKNVIMYSRIIPTYEKEDAEKPKGMSFGDFMQTMKKAGGRKQ